VPQTQEQNAELSGEVPPVELEVTSPGGLTSEKVTASAITSKIPGNAEYVTHLEQITKATELEKSFDEEVAVLKAMETEVEEALKCQNPAPSQEKEDKDSSK